VHSYRNYVRQIQASKNVKNYNLEEYDDTASICPVEEETASYVGPKLTSLAAIANLISDVNIPDPCLTAAS
jgi:hypothetical protein